MVGCKILTRGAPATGAIAYWVSEQCPSLSAPKGVVGSNFRFDDEVIQHERLTAKLLGHYTYYGITGNSVQLHRYYYQVKRIWRKWLARRTRSRQLPWEKFRELLARHPLPGPLIIHRYTDVSEPRS